MLDVGVPLLVFSTMLVVGLGLRLDDFRRVVRLPG
jgi:hypothetical protein